MTFYSSPFDPPRIREIAERHGFCHVTGLFAESEIKRLEHDVAQAAQANGGAFPDLYSCPSLRWIMLDQRVLDIARALMGERLVYYRQTTIQFEKRQGNLALNPFRDLHCDARGNADALDGAWENANQIYGAYRFAFYFRNYRDFSGGLKVVPGSHRIAHAAMHEFRLPSTVMGQPRSLHWIGSHGAKLPMLPFEMYNVPSMPGDLVVFNLRTYHSAGALRFIERPTLAIHPHMEPHYYTNHSNMIQPYPPKGRNAVFFDYGTVTEDADFYVKWRAALQNAGEISDTETTNLHADVFELRNDKIIAALALALGETLFDIWPKNEPLPAMTELAPATRDVAEKLLGMCRQHREFSAHHTLFDRARFDAAAEPVAALKVVVEGVRLLKQTVAPPGSGMKAYPA